MVKRLTVEMKAEPYVVATGDFAEMVSQESESIKVVDPFLALDGLRLIHQMNRPSNPAILKPFNMPQQMIRGPKTVPLVLSSLSIAPIARLPTCRAIPGK